MGSPEGNQGIATGKATAATARDRFADHTTPLISDAWYVAALSDEIGAQPFHRRIVGLDVVLYRTPGGAVVAMMDRCPHRGFPLSRSRLDGDTLVCGYHGMTFGPDGRCVRLPANGKPAPNIQLRVFEVVERPPLVWINPGRASMTVEALPDTAPLASAGWSSVAGYFHVPANYVAMHENLMDLTHFSYLHPDTVGTAGYADTRLDFEEEKYHVRIRRELTDSAPPPVFVAVTNCPPEARVDRLTDSRYWSPGAQVGVSRFSYSENELAAAITTHIYHFVTPENQSSFHYWWFMARDFLTDDASTSERLRSMTERAFTEDRDALLWIAQRVEGDNFRELSFPPDRPGLAVRKILARRAGSAPGG